jgi:hypothetical protein
MAAGTSVGSVFRVVVTLDLADAMTIVPGTYGLGDRWQASYRLTDASCAVVEGSAATDGSLEIDRVDTSIHGTFALTFPTGRVVAGFDAPFCGVAEATGGGSACRSFPLCPAVNSADGDSGPIETCIPFP